MGRPKGSKNKPRELSPEPKEGRSESTLQFQPVAIPTETPKTTNLETESLTEEPRVKRKYQKRKSETGNALPSDPNEFKSATDPYRPLVRPVIIGVSKTCEALGTQKLDSDEVEGGTLAGSALLYQYGGTFDARVLVALWIAGVTLPRVAAAVRNKVEQKTESPSLSAPQAPASLQSV